MEIEILATESLGVRGMCCLVKTAMNNVLIDPGLALGYKRYNFLPHPFQVATGIKIKEKIIARFPLATDIVFSHFHGDHVPLYNANPYQLPLGIIPEAKPGLRIWSKPPAYLSAIESKRAEYIFQRLGTPSRHYNSNICFSLPVSHGNPQQTPVTVMMTRIEEDIIFVHASDIQLLNSKAVSEIILWEPDILFVAGPPIYLNDKLDKNLQELARENAAKLSENIKTVILDHHLLRNKEGLKWLNEINAKTKNQLICAADFMNLPRLLLEANREFLYSIMPVPKNWHQLYAKGGAGLSQYSKLSLPLP